MREKLMHEIRTVATATLFFGAWIFSFMVIKTLVLAEYQVSFSGWSRALFGALLLGKVVIVLDRVKLGAWVSTHPAWLEVVLRTVLYAVGVFAVLMIERGIEGRHEHGGFAGAVAAAFHDADAPHVAVNTMCLSGALLVHNVFDVVRRNLGPNALLRMLMRPAPN